MVYIDTEQGGLRAEKESQVLLEVIRRGATRDLLNEQLNQQKKKPTMKERIKNRLRQALGIDNLLKELEALRQEFQVKYRSVRDVALEARGDADNANRTAKALWRDTSQYQQGIGAAQRNTDWEMVNQSKKVRNLQEQMTALRDALGGVFWRSAGGHTRPITLLSTDHLRNILAGGFADDHRTHNAIEDELRRREIDDRMRDRETDEEDAALINEILIHRTITDDGTAPFVERTPVRRKLTGRERYRIARLPKWAQQLINELEA